VASRFCPRCGRERGPGRFCGRCGHDFGAAAPDDTTTLPAEAAVPVYQPPPVDQPPSADRRDRRPGLWIAAAVVVLLAAGGGTYAFVSGDNKQTTAQPASRNSRIAASTPASPAASTPVTQATSAEPATTPLSPSPSLSPSAAPPPTSAPEVVSAGPAVGSVPPGVEVVLTRYFQGINQRDYAEYASSEVKPQTQSNFASGYRTTADSAMTVTALQSAGGGDVTATITFTSRQAASDSTTHLTCDDWTLNLYLVPDGTGYLIGLPPAGYEPASTGC
jgi:hypothetical protein